MKPVQAGNLQFHVACVANDKKARALKDIKPCLDCKQEAISTQEKDSVSFGIYIYIYLTNEFEFRQNLNAIASVHAFPLRSSLLDLPVIRAKNV